MNLVLLFTSLIEFYHNQNFGGCANRSIFTVLWQGNRSTKNTAMNFYNSTDNGPIVDHYLVTVINHYLLYKVVSSSYSFCNIPPLTVIGLPIVWPQPELAVKVRK